MRLTTGRPAIALFALAFALAAASLRAELTADVAVAGGGTGGTAAALQAARMGASVVLVEETPWLGGMITSGGVPALDGNNLIRSGIHREMLASIEAAYEGAPLNTGWVSATLFSPAVAQQVLRGLVDAEPNITLWTETRVTGVLRTGDRVEGIICSNGQTVRAHVVIDATELGDVTALAGIPHHLGREARSTYGESTAPEVSDEIVQDYTYCLILKNFGSGDHTIAPPPDYDPSIYVGSDRGDFNNMITYGRIRDELYMINWPVHGNDYYAPTLATQTSAERAATHVLMKNRSLGFLHYIQTALGHPEFGIAPGIYPTADGLPFYPYIRESRRIVGSVMMRLSDVVDRYADPQRPLYRQSIAVGDYAIDHHHSVPSGESFPVIPTVTVPMGSLIPRDVDGFLAAEKSIGVSHSVNGVTRLQPIVMNIGQAAGALAALAAEQSLEPRDVDVREVQQALLDSGCLLFPYRDVLQSHWAFQAIHRLSVAGTFRSVDERILWSSRSWFYPGEIQSHADAVDAFTDARGGEPHVFTTVDLATAANLSRAETAAALYELRGAPLPVSMTPHFDDVSASDPLFAAVQWFHEAGCDAAWITGGAFSPQAEVTRAQLAVAIDAGLDPFHSLPPMWTAGPARELERLPVRWLAHADAAQAGRTLDLPAWFTTATDAQRDMCFNPVTDHLLITDRAVPAVHIVDAETGSDAGSLDNAGITGGTLVLAAVGTDAQGVIYASNYDQAVFRLYRWASESAVPEIACSLTLPEAAGRRLEVRGQGPSTEIFVARAGTGGGFHVLGTADGIHFALARSVQMATGFTAYGTYGLTLDSDVSIWVRGAGHNLQRLLLGGSGWSPVTPYDPGLFDPTSTFDLLAEPTRGWLLTLANEPYVYDGLGNSTQSAGGLVYELAGDRPNSLLAYAPLARTNANTNGAGAVDVDLSGNRVFVLLGRNGLGAFGLEPLLASVQGLQWR